ncbi:DJ-1/PfpI family protein [Merismopedia glauca]|uniref:Thiamine biosynthesis protein ThiJ n=1 Tax=Merismopedia glauca CCAP 1448/3 TaxID=1296344 RepID=A0A2T1C4E4_9CYAN|nr:DJ-1/PfpI family protein [Merismopedia glauca]PSB03129.1 thiamine biosynthesis protein ThiJ [Merismopedia glauca CCAP 1448/3]
MIPRSLGGKKIAVLVESEFIPEEMEAYQQRFSELKATVHFMSRLWGQSSVRFFSDTVEGEIPKTLDVEIDFQDVDVNDYAAVIMGANYTSVRLRYFEPPPGMPISGEQVRNSPAVKFYAEAMKNPKIIKGALCHGLWLITPMPELLKDRRVICHEVVLADIVNAGAIYEPAPTGVVVDGDLVTGRSRHEVYPFIDAITEQIQQVTSATNLFSNRKTSTFQPVVRIAS